MMNITFYYYYYSSLIYIYKQFRKAKNIIYYLIFYLVKYETNDVIQYLISSFFFPSLSNTKIISKKYFLEKKTTQFVSFFFSFLISLLQIKSLNF